MYQFLFNEELSMVALSPLWFNQFQKRLFGGQAPKQQLRSIPGENLIILTFASTLSCTRFLCMEVVKLCYICSSIYAMIWNLGDRGAGEDVLLGRIKSPILIVIVPFPLLMAYRTHYFYRTRVRSLAMLVTHWLTHWLTHSVTLSKLDWCDPGV